MFWKWFKSKHIHSFFQDGDGEYRCRSCHKIATEKQADEVRARKQSK